MKYLSYSVVFQEVPNEVTVGINITNCPNRCKGCHSAILQQDIGSELNEYMLMNVILEKYKNDVVTCVCFFGGDGEPERVNELAGYLKRNTGYKVAWYSGNDTLSDKVDVNNFDYIKLGHYDADKGALTSETTNQRFYVVENGKLVDKTELFR